eukprot:3937366-Rhodomonas_salina.1
MALPPEVVSVPGVSSLAGAQSVPPSPDADPRVVSGLEQAGSCAAGAINGLSWAAGPTTVDAVLRLPRNGLSPHERSSSPGSLAEGRDMPSGSRSGDGSAATLTHGGGTGATTFPGPGVGGDPSERGAGSAGSPWLSRTSAEFVPRLCRHSLAEPRMTADDAEMPWDDLATQERSPSPGCLAEGGDTLPSLPATSENLSGEGSSAALPQGSATVAGTLPWTGGRRELCGRGAGSDGSPEERRPCNQLQISHRAA